MQVASVRVQLNQLREDLDGAVKSQDFARANEIKMQIAELDAEKVRLLESTEVVTEEVRTERVSELLLQPAWLQLIIYLRNRFALAVICSLIYHWLEVSR